MDKIASMRTFCSVVSEGGFSAAARRLGTSKVLVSRYISQLESDLGVRLLQRTTRTMSLTDDGHAYHARCIEILDDLDELDASIKKRKDIAYGKLRISVPSEAFTNRHLIDFFVEFSNKYPELEFDISLADRYVDIVEEGFDVAIRVGQLNDSSLIARKLADMELMLCASPEYLTENAKIEHPIDLNKHSVIIDSNFRGGHQYQFSLNEEHIKVKPKYRIKINSSEAVITFLKQGCGIGLCPSFMLSHEFEKGNLQRVLPQWNIMSGGIYVLYSHRKHLSAKVNLLTDSLIEHFKFKQL